MRVVSSHIEDVSYSPERQVMIVRFVSGVYEYQGVPADVYQAVVSAASVGSALASLVKGQYPYVRIE
jgi:hypothetical protein